MSESVLDQWVHRLQNLDGFNVYAITEDGLGVEPWMDVRASEIVKELVINDFQLRSLVESVTAQIQLWGRLTAKAKRVWEVEERRYRCWRSSFYVSALTPPEDGADKKGWSKTAKGEPKPPTKEMIDALYRTDPEYAAYQVRIERAEEAYNSAVSVLEAFRAQKDLLKLYAFRAREDGAVQLSV